MLHDPILLHNSWHHVTSLVFSIIDHGASLPSFYRIFFGPRRLLVELLILEGGCSSLCHAGHSELQPTINFHEPNRRFKGSWAHDGPASRNLLQTEHHGESSRARGKIERSGPSRVVKGFVLELENLQLNFGSSVHPWTIPTKPFMNVIHHTRIS